MRHKLSFLIYLVFFVGCLRVGLPEPVSSGGPLDPGIKVSGAEARLLQRAQSRAPFALLLTTPEPPQSRDDSFGHQYLLGIIPLTRVFAEHGRQQFVEEIAARVLAEQGYRVLFADAEDLPELSSEVPLARIIRPRVEALRVNAFDALVFRIADVSGKIAVDFFSPLTFAPLTSFPASLDENEYRKQAQAPVLSDLLARAVRSAIESALRSAPSIHQTRALSESVVSSPRKSSSEAPLWILPPAFSQVPPPGLGKFLAGSYGYDSVSPLGTTAVLRLMQRSLASSFQAGGKTVLSPLTPVDDLLPLHALRTAVEKLEFDDSGALQLKILFREEFSGIVERSAECVVAEPQASGVDGAAIVTLERGAARALEAYLAGSCA